MDSGVRGAKKVDFCMDYDKIKKKISYEMEICRQTRGFQGRTVWIKSRY